MDLMIDIETLSRRAGGVVHEIAAIAFVRSSHAVMEEFRVSIDPDEAESCGLSIEPETWRWWEDQGGVVLEEPVLPLREALEELTAFCRRWTPDRVWSCGTCFERPMLDGAFSVLGMPLPWEYWRGRDLRTVWDLAFPDAKRESGGHRALADCHKQLQDLALAKKVLLRSSMICVWEEDADGNYDSDCGEKWCFNNDAGALENGVKYCHHCGKKVEVDEFEEEAIEWEGEEE